MTKLSHFLEDLWNNDKFPQSAILESLDLCELDSEIMLFISSVTKKFTEVTSENNTDVFRVELGKNKSGSEARIINVEQIRSLQEYLSSTAGISPYKFAIISDADAMNVNASNCMLKILEDTPKNSFIFLLTKRLDNILPTIRSRCIPIFREKIIGPDKNQALGNEIYLMLNPEVRFEDKILIINKMNSDKNLKIEELISAITKILHYEGDGDSAELSEIRNYIIRKEISFIKLSGFSEEASFLLSSIETSFLDLRQILLLLISKFALL